MELPDLVGQFRDDVKQIADDSVVGHLEDRRVLVLVDRDDDFRRAHPRQVLDRARDADGDVERGADGLPVWPTWSACGRHPASTTARDAPTAAAPPNAPASSPRILKLAGSLRPRPPDP